MSIVSTAFATPSKQLVSLLSNIHAMTADFQQILVNSHGKILQKSTGNMALKRPNLFRWEIKQPEQQVIVADGNYLWVYDAALQQATKHRLNGEKSTTPAALLSSSVRDLQKRFVVSIPKNATAGQWFQLKPRRKNSAFNWVQLQFVGNQLVGMRFSDNLAQVSNVEFSNIQVNPPLPPQFFEFKPPHGADVVED